MAEKNAWTYDASTQILSPKMRSNALDQIGPSSSEFGTLVLLFRIDYSSGPRLLLFPFSCR